MGLAISPSETIRSPGHVHYDLDADTVVHSSSDAFALSSAISYSRPRILEAAVGFVGSRLDAFLVIEPARMITVVSSVVGLADVTRKRFYDSILALPRELYRAQPLASEGVVFLEKGSFDKRGNLSDLIESLRELLEELGSAKPQSIKHIFYVQIDEFKAQMHEKDEEDPWESSVTYKRHLTLGVSDLLGFNDETINRALFSTDLVPCQDRKGWFRQLLSRLF